MKKNLLDNLQKYNDFDLWTEVHIDIKQSFKWYKYANSAEYLKILCRIVLKTSKNQKFKYKCVIKQKKCEWLCSVNHPIYYIHAKCAKKKNIYTI